MSGPTEQEAMEFIKRQIKDALQASSKTIREQMQQQGAAVARAVDNLLGQWGGSAALEGVTPAGVLSIGCSIPVPEFDPATCITAGELRAVGVPVPAHVPDCGWIPRGAWSMKITGVPATPEETVDSVLTCDVAHTFNAPFRWISVPVTVEKVAP